MTKILKVYVVTITNHTNLKGWLLHKLSLFWAEIDKMVIFVIILRFIVLLCTATVISAQWEIRGTDDFFCHF